MPRTRTRSMFLCEACGHESPRWMGFCPGCGSRSPLVEFFPPPSHGREHSQKLHPSEAQELSQVTGESLPRLPVPFGELSRVLGGGLVLGSVVLMAGEPGVGKSTLLLQIAQYLADREGLVAYVTGEESPHQVKLRADRLGLAGHGIHVLPETDVELVIQQLDNIAPRMVVVDSVQTLHKQDTASGPGSPAQVRDCGLQITQWAKNRGVPVIMAGHITKDGGVAGPMVLEHMVDVVLYMDSDEVGSHRVLRSVKNRFGSTNEVGIFQMTSIGLEEVDDPSSAVLSQRGAEAIGSALVPILEGSRPLLVEVQALTAPSALSVPRRTANGLEYNRLLMLVAVLTRRAGVNLSGQDVIVNVAGGLHVREPAADLAIALAIASSVRNLPIPPRTVALGEVGLSGELRAVPQLDKRLAEAARLGLSSCFLPPFGKEPQGMPLHFDLITVPKLSQALDRAFPRDTRRRLSSQDLGEPEDIN